jgi:hypothetical protein
VSWLQVTGLAIRLFLAFVTFAREKKLMEAGVAATIKDAFEVANARIEKGLAARRAAAGSVSDDPYLRD